MGEKSIPPGFLVFLLVYVVFTSHFPSSNGAAKFTRFPPNLTVVKFEDNVRLEWNYTVGNKIEFEDNSPVWDYKSSSGAWKQIASEDVNRGWNFTISSECPNTLRTRLSKESVATLVINRAIPANSGRYRCTLMLLSSEDIPSEVEVIVNESKCVSNPCWNGGNCTDFLNGYYCTCSPGWEGDDCTKNIDDCVPNPCENEGNCTDLVNGFNCRCARGWTGQNCTQNIDDCVPNPCENGGRCVDKVNGFDCSCARGWTGQNCTQNINECASNSCKNGETTSRLGGAVIAGIVLGAILGIILIAVTIVFIYKKFSNKSPEGNRPTDKSQGKAVDQETEMKTSPAAKA